MKKIGFWHKNLFMLSKGSSGKDYIKEITSLINEWLTGSQGICNVRPTCDAGVAATEAIRVFKK